jgi:aryl-alcohol dehydrogenase-like predicted oxidoreductase
LAIGFVQAHAEQISTVLVGTSSVDHLERNIAAMGAAPLPPDVVTALRAIGTSPSEPS